MPQASRAAKNLIYSQGKKPKGYKGGGVQGKVKKANKVVSILQGKKKGAKK